MRRRIRWKRFCAAMQVTQMDNTDAIRSADKAPEADKPNPPRRLTESELALRRSRERWSAPGRAVVSHPDHHPVVVPCASPLAAIHCAAEVWRCSWMDVIDAKVGWAPENAPVTYPQKAPPV